MKVEKRLLIRYIGLLLIIFVFIPFCFAIMIYKLYFGGRFDMPENIGFQYTDFENLKRERYEFESNKKQKLVGYKYYKETVNPKGIIVFSHGYGTCGHRPHLDIIDYFTSNGYWVFAYDITGNGESEGKSIRGLPQGAIDMEYAVTFIKQQEEFDNLPLILCGHSWGGYSATNALNYHPDIDIVISFAGFNKSSDLLKSQGEVIIGKIIYPLMPYINIYEKMKFGKYASNTAMDGFENSDAAVVVVHSEDDNVVPKRFGYDIYSEKYADSDRFKFISYKDRGHNGIFYEDGEFGIIDEELFNKIFEFCDENLSK